MLVLIYAKYKKSVHKLRGEDEWKDVGLTPKYHTDVFHNQ